jgi:hypothetical protein
MFGAQRREYSTKSRSCRPGAYDKGSWRIENMQCRVAALGVAAGLLPYVDSEQGHRDIIEM